MARKRNNNKGGKWRGKSNRKPQGQRDFDRKDNMNEDKDSSRVIQDTPFNDFSWYNKYPSLIEPASRLQFVWKPGMNVHTGRLVTSTTTDQNTKELVTNIPGVFTIGWVPYTGPAQTANDPISIAAKEIFAQVRNVYSGSLDADPPDFVIYLLALDSIFSYIGSLKRIYRIVSTYTPENYLLPDALLTALGVSEATAKAIRVNKDQFLSLINELVLMTRKYKCPALFPLFNRHYWLNDNVYMDDTMPNSQMYAFHQRSFWKFAMQKTPDNVDAGGLAQAQPPLADGTPETLFEFGKSLIDALATSDDAYMINGYLKRAYEGTPSFSVDLLVGNEMFVPLYVDQVLDQIENCTLAPLTDADVGKLVVSQDPEKNILLCPSSFTCDGTQSYMQLLHYPSLNLYGENPAVEDIIEASRLLVAVNNVQFTSGTAGYTYDLVAATEIPTRYYLTTINNGKITNTRLNGVFTQSTALLMYELAQLSNFHRHPKFLVWSNSSSVSDYAGQAMVVADIHNINQFEPDQLKMIHRFCTYSELNSFSE